MRRIPVVLTVLGVIELGFLAVAAEPSRGRFDQDAVPIARAAPDIRPFIARADALFTRIREAHMTELAGAMRGSGPAGAISVCHVSSAQVIERIRREDHVMVGRTSDRLRNPTNVPPGWASPIVRQYAGARASSVGGFYVDLGDRIGVLRPMPEVAMCAGCHGAADKLSPAVRAVLKDRYPADRAVGFKDGEIRGWLWAEMPRLRARNQ